jgi:hypothetical protein
LRGLEVVRLDRRVQVIGPLHAAEDRRVGAGSNGAAPRVGEDSGGEGLRFGAFWMS